MLSSKRVRLSVYVADVASLDGSYHTNVELIKVERDGPLLTIENPQYKKVIDSHEHLRGVHVLDEDQKEKLPMHVILGKDVYARIKTPTIPRGVGGGGGGGRPIPLLNWLGTFGWFITSPGQEFDVRSVMLTQAYQYDYEQLCRTDVCPWTQTKSSARRVQRRVNTKPRGMVWNRATLEGKSPNLADKQRGEPKAPLNPLVAPQV